MASISLCMIVKNEEDVIGRCLECMQDLVDEIIIVDTGSCDATKEIASKYTDNVYDFTWSDDFSAARNESFSKATMDFTMWLDADDILKEADKDNFLKLKESLDPSIDIVMMKYNVGFDSHANPTLSYYRERILRRERGYQWIGAIHEVIQPIGNVIYSAVAVTHDKLHPTDPDRNLRIFEKIIADGVVLDPRQQFYYARELYYHARYQESIDILNAYLDEGNGWIENNISACQDLANCYYEMNQPGLALQALLRSFTFDRPRAELCCAVGAHFLERQQYDQAIFWYLTACERKPEEAAQGFQSPDCYGYIPYMQLCLCYDKVGDLENAFRYHQKAKKIKPEDSSVKFNEEYFNKAMKR